MRFLRINQRLSAAILTTAVIAVVAGSSHFRTVVRAQDNLTPGMLFGPIWVGDGQHLELCSTLLSEGDLTQFVHFRNLTTGEVTAAQEILIRSGGGGCVTYSGKGRVVGMARGDGSAADWVSPSNALIGTMSVLDDFGNTRVVVLGIAKLWLRGL